MRVNPRRRPDVYTVTNAPLPISVDIGHRQRRYLLSMGIRTACFLAAVFTAAADAPVWVAGILVAGAVILPYVSVVIANAGREPQRPAQFAEPERSGQNEISGPHPEIGS